MAKYKVHQGKTGPREPIKPVMCGECSGRYDGDAPATLVETWTAAHMDENGELLKGHKVWICLRCFILGIWSPFGPSPLDKRADEDSDQ